MTRPRILPALLVLLFCAGLAVETKAQAVTGYTEIDYYADTDTLDAYSETDLDDYLVGDYDAYVSLTVRDQNGSILSAASARDNIGNGYISIESLVYGTTPNTTYTATGFHKAIADLWDYQPYYPYQIFYYDNYNFTYFQNQGIYAPWYYYFLSPGFQQIQRNTAPISLGSTYDSDFVSTPPSPDIFLVNAKVYEVTATFDGFRVANVAVKNSQHWLDICGNPNDTQPFTITINFQLPTGGQLIASRCKAIPQNIPNQDYNIIGAVTCVMDDGVAGHMSIPTRRRYGGFADNNPGIHFVIGGNQTGQVGTIDTPGT